MVFVPLILSLLGCSSTPRAPAPVEPPEPAPVAAPDTVDLTQAIDWMLVWARQHPDALRFDAAIGAHAIAQRRPEAQPLLEEVLRHVDRDGGHPMRRFLDDAQQTPAGSPVAWTPPASGRANTNRVVIEALYCDREGWRPSTQTYVCGPMRDEGGYHSAHGLWALSIARARGCLAPDACWTALEEELIAAERETASVSTVPEVDLSAERLLVLTLAGRDDPVLQRTRNRLIGAQRADGSFGVLGENDPYYGFHATMLATWAFALD